MLLDRIKELNDLIAEKERIRIKNNQSKFFDTRKRQTGTCVQKLQSLTTINQLLVNQMIVQNERNQTLTKAEQLTQKVMDLYKEDGGTINDGQNLEQLIKTVNDLDLFVRQTMLLKWQKYVDQKVPELPEELLDVLGRIPSYRDKVMMLKRTVEGIKGYKKELPQSEVVFLDLDNKAENLNVTWNAMNTGEVPGEVIEFLKKAVSDGALLYTLNDTIRVWLTQHQLDKVFRIKLV